MTVSTTTNKVTYAGNGSTASFAIPFPFTAAEDIQVVLSTPEGETGLALGTDYLLSGMGQPSGGTCGLTAPPAWGETLVIRRDPAIIQEVDYIENDAFPAETHEAALDRLTMICQALDERLDRTLSFRVSSAVTGVNMPEPDPGRLLGWDESGDNLRNADLADRGEVVLPLAVGQGGTGAETPGQALDNLGFGAAGKDVAAAGTTDQALAALDAEPADPAILKADLPDLLRSVFGDEAQVHTGPDLSTLAVARNHVAWTLSGPGQFGDVALPYDGTYVFHVYPSGNALALAASYKTDGTLPEPDSSAGEIRIVIEQYNSRKTIVALQNMEA
jgi:hypothetical protein